MPNSGTRGDACEALDADLAESIVLRGVCPTALAPAPGGWLQGRASQELRALRSALGRKVAEGSDQPVLRVELFDRRARSAVKVQGCEEVEDAVSAFLAMIPLAKSYET